MPTTLKPSCGLKINRGFGRRQRFDSLDWSGEAQCLPSGSFALSHMGLLSVRGAANGLDTNEGPCYTTLVATTATAFSSYRTSSIRRMARRGSSRPASVFTMGHISREP